MKNIAIAAAIACLTIAQAPPVSANVVYTFSNPPPFLFPNGVDTITVSDAAYEAGTLTFSSFCDDMNVICAPDPPPADWVSGFEFPTFSAVAEVNLTFVGRLLSGLIHVDLQSIDLAWDYRGSGTNWTATEIDGPETFTSTGLYTMVGNPPDTIPEPASVATLATGMLGLAWAQRKRRQARA
jgi:hypothetical protein